MTSNISWLSRKSLNRLEGKEDMNGILERVEGRGTIYVISLGVINISENDICHERHNRKSGG